MVEEQPAEEEDQVPPLPEEIPGVGGLDEVLEPRAQMMLSSIPMSLSGKTEKGFSSPSGIKTKVDKSESEPSSSSDFEKSEAEGSSKSGDKDDHGKVFVKSKKKRKRRDH